MKYIFLSDIEYLIHNKKRLLFIMFLLALISILINININVSCIDLINLTMGTNFHSDNYTILELIMFIFNVVVYLFFIIDIYIKDIEYQLDNIFLRLNPCKWYLRKTLIFIITMFITKFFQYLIIAIILLIKNKLIFLELLFIMILDYIYILLLQLLFLFIYVLISSFYNSKFITIGIFLIILYFIPKNIYDSRNLIFLFTIIIFILSIVICIIFIFRNKTIIENCRR